MIYPFVEFDLKGYQGRSEYESWVRAYYDAQRRMIFAENGAEERPYDWFHGFCSTDYEVSAFETSKNSFVGVYGDIRMPKALEEGALKNSLAACETMNHTITFDPCVPSDWKYVKGTRKYKGAEYLLEIYNENGNTKGVKRILVDGKEAAATIPSFHDNGVHKVEIYL